MTLIILQELLCNCAGDAIDDPKSTSPVDSLRTTPVDVGVTLTENSVLMSTTCPVMAVGLR